MDGIIIDAGTTTIANNIISLGYGETGGYLMFGISDLSESGSNNSYLFNTVFIGGTTSGSTSSTYAIKRYNADGMSIYRNNIFVNAREGGNGGNHYAIDHNPSSLSGFASNYNLFHAPGSNGILGSYRSGNKTSLSAWQASTSGDNESVDQDPQFVNQGGTEATDYKILYNINGLTGTGILSDYAGSIRAIIPSVGAWEYTIRRWKGTINTDFGTPANWTSGTVPSTGDDVIFDDAPLRDCILDADRTIGSLINGQSEYSLVVNGYTLTINGNPVLTNGANIVATDPSSEVVFAGDDTINITPGFFANNRLFSLVAGNDGGLDLGVSLVIDGSLTINSGSSLRIAAGIDLTVSGLLTNNNGNDGLYLYSDATGTASLMHNSDNVHATVYRYIDGDPEDWHFIAAPLTGQAITGDWLPSGTYGNGTGYDLYVWNEEESCWVYKMNTSVYPDWTSIHPESTFKAGAGYLYSLQASGSTKSFSGVLNNGNVKTKLTADSENSELKGFVLAGNPYPSAIDWQSATGWTRSDLVMNGSGYDMWIWNPEANNYGVINSAGGTGTNSITRYVSAAQGFFVRAASSGFLAVDNNARVNGSLSGWMKNGEPVKNLAVKVTVRSNNEGGYDEVALRFAAEQGGSGAPKLFSPVETAPSLYVSNSGMEYSTMNFRDSLVKEGVPLYFKPGRNGSFQMNVSFDNEAFGTLLLEDRQMQNFYDLKQNNTYSFIGSANDMEQRFVIHFDRILPGRESITLPASIYISQNRLIVDLTAVTGETMITVTGSTGKNILRKKVQGENKYEFNLDQKPGLLLVGAGNKSGSVIKKVMWITN